MPGDQPRDPASRAVPGPRHAAPRIPLLTRLPRPVGRAVVVAAVPTAVLMGIGLAPQLAAAEAQPDNPFADGPCVSSAERQEKQDERQSAKREATEAAKRRAAEATERKAAAAKAEREATEEAKRKAAQEAERKTSEPAPEQPSNEQPSTDKPSTDKPSTDKPSPEPSPSPSDESSGGSETPQPSPSESESGGGGLLGGVGDAAKGLLGAGAPRSEPIATVTGQSDTPSPSPSSPSSDGDSTGLGLGLTDSLDAARKRLAESGEKAVPESAAGGTGDSGKKRFPCVEEKKVEGEAERTSVVLPNQPFSLEASSVTLRGLKYHGVVNVATESGQRKQVLKFTTESADIGDLHQLVEGPNGSTYHVRAGKGSVSQIRGGTVTMYTERLEGNLFGVLPVIFDPEHPPPLDLPFARFTEVKIRQAGQLGGNLTVPQLEQHVSDS